VLISPKGDQLLYVIRLHFCDTHNVAEYEALANSLRIIVELGVQWLYIRGDCELIINQVMGESNCHDSHIVPYCHGVRRLEGEFNGFELRHILRRDSKAADALARLGSSPKPPPLGVSAQDLLMPSIRLEEDTLACLPRASPGRGSSITVLGTPPGENNRAQSP
jgi:hypothetical protein